MRPSAASTPVPVTGDAPVVARQAGLRYVSDSRPGISRKPAREGFHYFDAGGNEISDEAELKRIRSIVIPPAWTDVWICPWANGHIQATGRDARMRKQYRYHPRWREVRDETKYERLIGFAQALPAIRKQVDLDLKLPGLPRQKVLATIVYLLQATMMRIGNEEYARTNKSFGLTTLRNRHVQVNGNEVDFCFKGKSGVKHRISIHDRRLAKIVGRLRDLPGQELFEYVDQDGEVRAVDSADVNDYLREMTGEDYTAKDFRTWSGTMLAAMALREFEVVDSEVQARKNIVRAIENVAERLGNTPAVCRKCYVHPGVLDSYLDGTMLEAMGRRAHDEWVEQLPRHTAEEAAVLTLLKARLEAESLTSGGARMSNDCDKTGVRHQPAPKPGKRTRSPPRIPKVAKTAQ